MLLELADSKEVRVQKDQREQLVLLDRLEMLVSWVHRDPRVNQDQLDLMALQVLLVRQVIREHPVLKEIVELLVPAVSLVTSDLRVLKGQLGHLEVLEHQAQMDRRVSPELLVQLEPPDLLAVQEHLEATVNQAPQELRDSLVQRDLSVQLVQLDCKVPLDRKVTPVSQDFWETRETLDNQAHKVPSEHKASLEQLGIVVLVDQLEWWVVQGYRVRRDPQVLLASWVLLV